MAAKQLVVIFFFIVAGLVLPTTHASDIHVLVRSEVSGTEIIYHYELVNHTTNGKMEGFSIGAVPADPVQDLQDATSVGELTRLPTGTVWQEAPAMSLEYPEFPNPRAGYLIPVPSPTGITSPPGWRAEISGALRIIGGAETPEDIARERYVINWYAPKPVYRGPVNVTGADAGQRLSGFSVRVPRDSTTGPGAVGSLTNYTAGHFIAEIWFGSSWIGKTQEIRRGLIEPQRPDAPGSLVNPASSTTGSYTVSWGAANGVVQSYELEEATVTFQSGCYRPGCVPGKICTQKCQLPPPVVSAYTTVYRGLDLAVTLNGKANNTYVYRVRACNATGCSDYRASTVRTVVAIP